MTKLMRHIKINIPLLALLTAVTFGPSLMYGQGTGNDSLQTSRDTAWGPSTGDWEFTLGGSGSSDKKFDNGGFGLSGSVGYFTTDALEFSVRQSFSYSNYGNSILNGSTRVAMDYHFLTNDIRPFVGVNLGGVYGESVEETLASGVEGGLKWYVKEKTFIFGMAEYQWMFEKADDAVDSFGDGQFLYSVGVGFNY